MSERPVQYFTDEYLEQCQKMTPDQICRFIDDFRRMVHTSHEPAQGQRSNDANDEAAPSAGRRAD